MRQRQHVNPLGLGFETFRGEKPALVPGRPVEVEIGCAEAQFLIERARVEPRRHYVGIEIREHLVAEVNDAARAEGLPVEVVFCNANHHLEKLFPARSVSRVYLNFPDPWFKRRHRKRRMIDDGLIASIWRVLAPDGEVFFQSDVWDVALDTLDLFERADGQFENAVSPWSFWRRGNPYGARSWREQHCAEAGLPVWRLLYRPRDPDEAASAGGSGTGAASDSESMPRVISSSSSSRA